MQELLAIRRIAGIATRMKPVILISIKEAIRCLSLVIEIRESGYRICRDQRWFWNGEAIKQNGISLELDCILSYSNIHKYILTRCTRQKRRNDGV